MVLELHGSSLSVCTKRVAMVLNELNVPFKFFPVDLKNREQKSSQHLEKQPFGKIPFIVDDGFVLYESRAICRYIATKYAEQGPPLIPKDLQAWAKFEQAASVELCNFDPYAVDIVVENYFMPLYGKETNTAVLKVAIEKLNASLEAYDRILSKQKYLGGDEFTLADLFHIPISTLLPGAGFHTLQENPNVKRQAAFHDQRLNHTRAAD
ncbi:hypothetical protein CCMSSC00406_0003898 [Pleurotus cornucopiae]|uniref:Uncharacterized protein n=1 Tax=Pleurotus cornucopiae TaxID=5321 RepID=A0ACB7IQF8_PLECO|nr:hypothetical protein CCMSSC00406_0003898 [Pleurotus cornucopiae]